MPLPQEGHRSGARQVALLSGEQQVPAPLEARLPPVAELRVVVRELLEARCRPGGGQPL